MYVHTVRYCDTCHCTHGPLTAIKGNIQDHTDTTEDETRRWTHNISNSIGKYKQETVLVELLSYNVDISEA